jgi:hypothetical protein
MTPISSEDEAARSHVMFPGPRNTQIPMRGLSPRDAFAWVRGKKPQFFNHIPASKVRRALGPAIWDSYFSFTIERNPWDRAVSLYFYNARMTGNTRSFSRFLSEVDPLALTNHHLYSLHGQVICDRVLMFESLAKDLGETWETLGLPVAPNLGHSKGDIRPSGTRDYRTMYQDKDVQLISNLCRQEISAFGYRFNSA